MTDQGKRQTADQRRATIIQCAIDEFAEHGFAGGSTLRVADAAGISQPYVLRLFSTKKALFIAALEHVCDHVITSWTRILATHAVDSPAERLQALGAAYRPIAQQSPTMRLILQGAAASGDPEIRTHMQRGMERLIDWLLDNTGADMPSIQTFFAQGMMLTIAGAIGAPDIDDQRWTDVMVLRPTS